MQEANYFRERIMAALVRSSQRDTGKSSRSAMADTRGISWDSQKLIEATPVTLTENFANELVVRPRETFRRLTGVDPHTSFPQKITWAQLLHEIETYISNEMNQCWDQAREIISNLVERDEVRQSAHNQAMGILQEQVTILETNISQLWSKAHELQQAEPDWMDFEYDVQPLELTAQNLFPDYQQDVMECLQKQEVTL